jgi:hypothetical protein
MALLNTTVTISLRFPTTQTVAKTVRFIPNFAAAEDQVLLEEFYDATVSPTTPSADTTLSGTINLPSSDEVTIPYRVELPVTSSKKSKYINLDYNAGGVNLADLLTDET